MVSRPRGGVCALDQWILFRNHGFARGGNLCAVKRTGTTILSDMMKDVNPSDHMGGRQAAALVEDGKLQDLFLETVARNGLSCRCGSSC